MVVTNVSVNVLTKKQKLRGVASIVLDDCFKVTEILILQSNPNTSPFIVMPYKAFGKTKPKDGKQQRKSVAYPITQDCFAQIKTAVLDEYIQKLDLIKHDREGDDETEPDNAENENQSLSGATPDEKSPDQNLKAPSIDDDYKEED